jgi:CheY-like chemotaxis protein
MMGEVVNTPRAKKILVIDDEENYCRVIKKALESRGGFHVLTATRGREGIVLAKIQKPDLILLDIMMPAPTGTHVAGALSEDPDTRSIPVIFVTAIVTKDEVGQSDGTFGGQLILAKPVIIDELVKKINSLLPDI